MSWNIKTPGDYINGPLTVAGSATITGALTVDTTTLVVNPAGYPDRVGIGTATPATRLDVNGGTGGISGQTHATFSGTAGRGLVISTRSDNTSADRSGVFDAPFTGGTLAFQTLSTDRMVIDASANVNITSGNVVMGTSGKGIDFTAAGNAFGMTSELLNDYEEGTWTGTLKGSVSDPTTPVTVSGRYTKIGRQVYVQIHFAGVNTTGASGAVSITGLPFANNGSISSQGSILSDTALTFTGSPFVFVDVNGSTFLIYQSTSNAAATACTHNAGTARYLYANLTYTVA